MLLGWLHFTDNDCYENLFVFFLSMLNSLILDNNKNVYYHLMNIK